MRYRIRVREICCYKFGVQARWLAHTCGEGVKTFEIFLTFPAPFPDFSFLFTLHVLRTLVGLVIILSRLFLLANLNSNVCGFKAVYDCYVN